MRKAPLADDEVTTVHHLPTTSLVRTVADVARTEPMAWAVAAADAALARGLTKTELREAVERHPRRAGKRAALAVIEFGSASAESPLESISRLNLRLAGLPAPEE